jgi:hypothetical protein
VKEKRDFRLCGSFSDGICVPRLGQELARADSSSPESKSSWPINDFEGDGVLAVA